MSIAKRIVTATALGAAALLAFTACTSGAGASETVQTGKLTIATGEPAYAPWVEDDKPESGKGFEAAVAYAVAKELGYAKKDVVWTRTTFDSAIAPGEKDWDLNIQQFSVTPEREKVVDFSTPYYITSQAVVANADGKAAQAKSIKDLQDVVIGVAAGTTSLTVAENVIKPKTAPQVFNSVDDAVQALQNGTIDALVTDTPGAFYVRDAQLDNGVIVGQLDAGSDAGDKFAFVLPKGSALTKKVNKAVDTLRSNGTLDKLAEKWIANSGAPVLK